MDVENAKTVVVKINCFPRIVWMLKIQKTMIVEFNLFSSHCADVENCSNINVFITLSLYSSRNLRILSPDPSRGVGTNIIAYF